MSITYLSGAFPDLTEDEIVRAVTISQGDVSSAQGILQALVKGKQQQTYSISIAAQQAQERKEKELAKQRKNKSAIYANRGGAAPAPVAQTPTRPKRNNNDSDSDEDNFKGDDFDSDASDAEDRTNDSELEAICTLEALEYFNTADAEGLVMMIGLYTFPSPVNLN
jgi:hypothetical protein